MAAGPMGITEPSNDDADVEMLSGKRKRIQRACDFCRVKKVRADLAILPAERGRLNVMQRCPVITV